MTWQVAALGQKVHREQLDSGLPDDLAAEFHALSHWARGLARRFGSRVTVGLVDVASIEGFFKSLFRGFHRYPAFVVDGRKYVGTDYSRVDALIVETLAARRTSGLPNAPEPPRSASISTGSEAQLVDNQRT